MIDERLRSSIRAAFARSYEPLCSEHRVLCRHRNGAKVIISTETIVGPDLRVTEGLNHA
jgi:hypothetical protein